MKIELNNSMIELLSTMEDAEIGAMIKRMINATKKDRSESARNSAMHRWHPELVADAKMRKCENANSHNRINVPNACDAHALGASGARQYNMTHNYSLFKERESDIIAPNARDARDNKHNSTTGNIKTSLLNNYPDSIDKVIAIAASTGMVMEREEADKYLTCRLASDWIDANNRKIKPVALKYDIKKWCNRANEEKREIDAKKRENERVDIFGYKKGTYGTLG